MKHGKGALLNYRLVSSGVDRCV